MMAGFRRWRARLFWKWRFGLWPSERRAWAPRRRGRAALVLLLLLVGLLGAGGLALLWFDRAASETDVAGPAGVTDADTLAVGGRIVRLHGVDAPELRQTCRRADGSVWPCGQMAAAALALQLGGRPVLCRLRGNDRYGRAIGRCWAEGEEINAWLVREGWAVAYARYSWRYLPQQTLAWWEGRGIWQGSFDTPEDWRRAQQR
jgi:endonuclease YncB( thermonuclease family)